MKQNIKEINARRTKWRKALRSGRYQQTTGCLARKGTTKRSPGCSPSKGASFCCLGVAARVCRFDEGKGGLLSSTNAKLLGLTRESLYAVAYLNDNEGRTFKQIASHKLLRNLK